MKKNIGLVVIFTCLLFVSFIAPTYAQPDRSALIKKMAERQRGNRGLSSVNPKRASLIKAMAERQRAREIASNTKVKK